jgi:hypothetical protein
MKGATLFILSLLIVYSPFFSCERETSRPGNNVIVRSIYDDMNSERTEESNNKKPLKKQRSDNY